METLERLARRIGSAQSLEDVVGMMKTLSAVGVRHALAAREALRDYEAVVDLGLRAALEGAAFGVAPDPSDAPPHGPRILIVLGAGHGLCGRFDESVAERATAEAAAPPQETLVAASGLRIAERLAAAGLTPTETLAAPNSVGGLADAANALLVLLDRWRRERGAAEAILVRNGQSADAPARPAARRLLPASRAWLAARAQAPWPGRGAPMRPAPRAVALSHLLRQHLFVGIHAALAESLAAEHAARLAVMQGAERNIADHLAEMRSAYRARRQEAVTTELIEVAAGYEALLGEQA